MQVKLANKGQMISENFFVRGDGTVWILLPSHSMDLSILIHFSIINFYKDTMSCFQCAFYFSEDKLLDLFERNGFRTLDVNVYCKEIVNRSQNIVMERYGKLCPFTSKAFRI